MAFAHPGHVGCALSCDNGWVRSLKPAYYLHNNQTDNGVEVAGKRDSVYRLPAALTCLNVVIVIQSNSCDI